MQKKKLAPVLGAVLFVVVAAVLAVVLWAARVQPTAGDKHITVEVVHGDGATKEFAYDTDADYLGEVLLAEGLIQGTEGAYGLYVETVDGETADYGTDQSWWALTINGEFAQTGVDATPLNDGETYALTYTVG